MTWHAYFDESGTDQDSDYLVLAGYVFEVDRFVALDSKWAEMLAARKDSTGRTLPYFHMSSCAHNQKVFAHFSRSECDEIAREAIKLTHDHISFGFAVSIEKKFAHNIPTGDIFDSPYTFACWQCLMAVRWWADQNNYHGDIVYFFEQGHDSQGEANRILQDVLSKEQLKPAYRAAGHGFYDKRKVRPLQCADILAWQWLQQTKRWQKLGIVDPRDVKMACRKDFSALIGDGSRYAMQLYDEPQIRLLSLTHAVREVCRNWRSILNLGEYLIHEALKIPREKHHPHAQPFAKLRSTMH